VRSQPLTSQNPKFVGFWAPVGQPPLKFRSRHGKLAQFPELPSRPGVGALQVSNGTGVRVSPSWDGGGRPTVKPGDLRTFVSSCHADDARQLRRELSSIICEVLPEQPRYQDYAMLRCAK
jgi:hypothetical protein